MLDLQPSLGPALVVGGGRVALRKARALAAAAFATTVIAPEVREEIVSLPGVHMERREWRPGDGVSGFALVFACTDDRAVNQAVGQAARAAGIPVVVADSQDESTAFSPAIHRDGDLMVGVSTGGASPALAIELRDRIATTIGEGLGDAVARARASRRARP